MCYRLHTCISNHSASFTNVYSIWLNRQCSPMNAYVPATSWDYGYRLLFSPQYYTELTLGKRDGTAALCKQIKLNSDQHGKYCTRKLKEQWKQQRPVLCSSFGVCMCRFNESNSARTRRSFHSETCPFKWELTTFSDSWQVGELLFLSVLLCLILSCSLLCWCYSKYV